MRTRLSGIAIALATLVAGAAVGTSTGTAAAGPSEDTIRLTIKVAHCGSCELSLVQAREDATDDYWSTDRQKVEHGQVVFDVPATRTQGTSITIDAPWATAYIHGIQFVAIRYGDFRPGTKVSKRQALRADRGGRCWSGTDRDRTIHVQVARRTYGPGNDVGLRAWANPTLKSTDMTDIFEGSIVTTVPFCPAP